MDNTLKPNVGLFVTDLDNTVWDWFDAWHESFVALLMGLHDATGISLKELEREIRPIHQARFTSEYSWLIEEMASLQLRVPPGGDVRVQFEDAIHRQNSARKHATRTYPNVVETLRTIRASGVPVVAYTESLAFWTRWRMKRLNLDGLIDRLYSSPDHDAPSGVDISAKRWLPTEDYEFKFTEHHHVPAGIVKPDPHILQQIIDEYGVDPSEVVYVGDSMMKDVAMAQTVGALDVYAKYGDSHLDPRYLQLQRVSHWPDVAVEREQSTAPGIHPTPSYVLDRDFSQLLDLFNFGISK
jgi:FMN phosphatase YigB (HAD superfamily)